jgi:nucleotide-binding universal stress UspA family protein
MFDEIFACLDGSPVAETILPLARGLANAARARLTVLRVVVDSDEMATEANYLRDCARAYGAQMKFLTSAVPAKAIVAELERVPSAIAAMTTHGRTAWAEAVLGSVALNVIQNAGRPVIVYRSLATHQKAPSRIRTIATALDGSPFSETIVPFAVEFAKAIDGKLMLLQVLPAEFSKSAAPGAPPGDILETSYLHAKAAGIERTYGIEPNWDILHGEPGNALSRYVNGIPETLLAMTSRAHGGAKRAVLGGTAAACVRNAGVPMLIYCPPG